MTDNLPNAIWAQLLKRMKSLKQRATVRIFEGDPTRAMCGFKPSAPYIVILDASDTYVSVYVRRTRKPRAGLVVCEVVSEHIRDAIQVVEAIEHSVQSVARWQLDHPTFSEREAFRRIWRNAEQEGPFP